MPVALTLSDIEVLARHLSMSIMDFFDSYCIVYPASPVNTNDPIGSFSYLSIGLPPPCPFLVDKKCGVHEYRSKICRIFPYNIYVTDRLELYREVDYPCIDPVFSLTPRQKEEYKELATARNNDRIETYTKIPSLEEGIRYDERSIHEAMLLEGRLESCVSSEDKAQIMKQLMDKRIAFGMDLAYGKVRHEMAGGT